MCQACGQVSLAGKAFAGLWGGVPHQLQGAQTARVLLLGEVDRPHTARAQLAEDLKAGGRQGGSLACGLSLAGADESAKILLQPAQNLDALAQRWMVGIARAEVVEPRRCAGETELIVDGET